MESKPRDMDLIRLGARGFPWRPHKSAVDRSLAEVYRSTRGGAANRARVAEEASRRCKLVSAKSEPCHGSSYTVR